MRHFTIGVVGNPNCGKTTLFNALTGAKQRVGNWPGVTVDRKTGEYVHNGFTIEVVDTPGIYSLAAASIDETVTRDYVLSGQADLIVNIIDASNIERNLYLTTHLLEMHAPVVVALNMMDIAHKKQIEIDVAALTDKLGCPVVPMVVSKKTGITQLKDLVNQLVPHRKTATAKITYQEQVQAAIAELVPSIKQLALDQHYAVDWLAVKLLEGDEQLESQVDASAQAKVQRLRNDIETEFDDDADILIATARYEFINNVTQDTLQRKNLASNSLSDKLDRVLLNRFLGIPIFLLAMYLMFIFTINLGGAFIDFFDIFAGTIFVDGFALALTTVNCPAWLITILADGIGGGMQTMATFIPPIGFMFLFLSFLEDSGYMARAAFVMDRFMRVIGLPGKAFIPMLVGFGCNVPAIMATRTLDNERDRILTVMMNPFMSCGARLPVYALFAAAFFPRGGQNLIFLLYLIGIGFAIITGLLLKNTLLKGETTPYIMELPPYHVPTPRAIILSTYDRLKAFLFKAGKVLMPVIMVLAFLNSLGSDGTFGHNDSNNSALSAISRTITPILKPLGVSEDNWPATVGIFTGIFAKEAVVGTLDALYNSMKDQSSANSEEEIFDFWDSIGDSFATIPANLIALTTTFTDPLGISIGDISDTTAAAEEQEVNVRTFGAMVNLFGSKVAAFAYLLFILLYFPCCAAIAAVYRETNLMWTIFSGSWTTFIAYFAAVIFYQSATIYEHPISSLLWVATMLALLAIAILAMKTAGDSNRRKVLLYANGKA